MADFRLIRAFDAWLRTFDASYSFEQFHSPLQVQKILRDIDSSYFETLAVDNSDFKSRFNSYTRITEKLSEFYTGIYHTRPDVPSAVRLARLEGAQDESLETPSQAQSDKLKLLELLLLVAIGCERKQVFIERIQQLEELVQTTLMHVISGSELAPEAEGGNAMERSVEFGYEEEIARLLQTNERHKAEISDYEMKLKVAEDKLRELQIKAEEESPLPRTEISNGEEHLKDIISQLEHRAMEDEAKIKEQARTIQQLVEETSKSQSLAVEVDKLKQELSDSAHEITQLRKIESVADRYKRKLEQIQDSSARLASLEAENIQLKEELEKAEATSAKVVEVPSSVPQEDDPVATSKDITPREVAATKSIPPKSSPSPSPAELEPASSHPLQPEAPLDTSQFKDLVNSSPKQAVDMYESVVSRTESLQHTIDNLSSELRLMSGAWYSLASRVQQQNVIVMKKVYDSPQGWLTKQRRALDQV